MTRSLLLLSAFIAFAAFSPAIAQDKATKGEPKKEAAKPAEKIESVLKKDPTPAAPSISAPVKKWLDAENALIDPLSDKDKESFLILREKYSLIKTIGIAEGDIDEAVKSCGKNNPDMKDKMEERFKQWRSAVDPIIDTATKTFNKDLESQKIVDAGKARDVLDLQDEAYEYNEKQTTKQIVTTKEACQGLLDSMDSTEDQMVVLLQKTLLPESVVRLEYEQSQKAKAKAEAKKKAKEKPASSETKAE